jgi:hypothetical protein
MTELPLPPPLFRKMRPKDRLRLRWRAMKRWQRISAIWIMVVGIFLALPLYHPVMNFVVERILAR